ncbi:MAG TPA: FecR family protein [Gammaproteobacteria bacterium]
MLAGLFLNAGVAAAEAEPAGQVIVASGTVQAVAANGEVRALRRRSPFYAGDTLRTAAASEVQLRFADGALLSLRAESEFRVDEYRFSNQGGSGDRSVSTLLKGGLRTITGVIGKQDPQAYQVKTPVATIGVRGTHYEAVLESPKSLVLAAWQGGIRVRNDRGVIDLGMGAAYNFARTGSEQPPQGLLEPPPALQSEAPIGQAQPAEQQAAAEDGTTEQAEGETAGTDTAAPTDSAVKSGDAEGPGAAPPPENAPPPPMDSALGAPLANGLDTGCGTCAPPQQIVVNEPADVPSSQDLRFSTSEWNALQTTPYLGIWTEANTIQDFGFDGGRALYHGSNSPVLTENGYGPHEPQFATAPILDVLRRAKASVDAFGSYSVDAAHTVYWGTWNGNVNPVEIQTDPANGAIKELIYSPVHWATLLPTDAAAIAARTGTVSYNNVVVVHGGGSGGGPLTTANVNFNANVNFDTGAVTAGALNINNGPEVWNMNFTGQVRGNVLDIPKSALTGNVTVTPTPARPIEGDLGMVFTGNSGQALGGGFSFQEIGNPGRHVEGILVVR